MKEQVKLNRGYLVYQYTERNGKPVKLYVQKSWTPRTDRTIDTFDSSIVNAEIFETYEEAEKVMNKYGKTIAGVEEDTWTLNVIK